MSTTDSKQEPSVVLKIAVTWDCPNCKTENIDFFDTTINPMCENCMAVFPFDELLTESEYNRANAAYAAIDDSE